MKLCFFIKINVLLIFLILNFNKKSKEMKLFIKIQGDDLEEIILKFLKLSTTHRYIPNRVLLCLHFLFIKILISEENEENDIPTCRKIEKKDKYLHKKNSDFILKPKIPKYFYDFEKNNNFIEKFYRRNMIKKEKSDLERVVIVNILKILLSTIENNSSTSNTLEYTKDYIPEIILKYFYIDHGNIMTFTVETTNNNTTNNNLMNISNNNLELGNISGNYITIPPTANDSIKIDDKENIEFSSKTYLEILQTSQEADLYNIIDIVNKVSITSLIIYFYYTILKNLQNYDLIQYSYFSFHLIDSNGLLVFLKILSQDFKAIEQQFINIYETDIINIQYGELIEFILLFNLKLIYKTCYKNEEYILKYLVECKLQIMLKKVLNSFPDNEKIKKYCMKLFKCQLKYFDKNWRLENAHIISNIYLTLKIRTENDIIENYLKYEKKEKNLKDIVSDLYNNEELKKIHSEYHLYNYTRFYNNPEEFDKYQNGLYQSLYASIYLQLSDKAKLTDAFIENYK